MATVRVPDADPAQAAAILVAKLIPLYDELMETDFESRQRFRQLLDYEHSFELINNLSWLKSEADLGQRHERATMSGDGRRTTPSHGAG
jgi:hypothetical protein